ncbi:PAS domain-containing protein [Rhizobium ruizarguesonis]|nr:PAS domain-containing protein [Rhizobium ruizarguesonis]
MLVDLFQYQPEFVNRFVRLVELSTRCPSDEMLGRNCRFLQGAGSSSAAVAATRLAVAERRGMSIEILGYRQDAGPFWNSLHISPIEHDAGEITTSSLQDRRQRIQKGAVKSLKAPSTVGGRPPLVVRLAGRQGEAGCRVQQTVQASSIPQAFSLGSPRLG